MPAKASNIYFVFRLSLSDGATNDGHSELGSEGEACPFSKDPSGRYVVLYTFTARDENDVDVERGEFVTGIFYYMKKIPKRL